MDGLRPLGLGRLHVAHEIVQVPHQAGHDLLEPRVGRVLVAVDDRGGNVVLVEIAHRVPQRSYRMPRVRIDTRLFRTNTSRATLATRITCETHSAIRESNVDDRSNCR